MIIWIRQRALKKGELRKSLYKIAKNPSEWEGDINWSSLAKSILEIKKAKSTFTLRPAPAMYKIWGSNIDPEATKQLVSSCMLPVSVYGALMPDGHVGYGLPIGGVLATDNCVIPYAVGVDIACRMRLSVFDQPISLIETKRDKLVSVIEKETRFGLGCSFSPCRQHPVMDDDWSFCKTTKDIKDLAWSQLGTSGSSNHFCEFGEIVFNDGSKKLALLTHSGSRRAGGEVAKVYSAIAKQKHQELPKELLHLAWLDLDSEDGQIYWKAMQLMGKYAAANHELVHNFIQKRLGYNVVYSVENHHNFAWKEKHFGKGAEVRYKCWCVQTISRI